MRQALNMRRFRPDEDLLSIAAKRPGSGIKHDPAEAAVTLYAIPPSLCSQRVRMTLRDWRDLEQWRADPGDASAGLASRRDAGPAQLRGDRWTPSAKAA